MNTVKSCSISGVAFTLEAEAYEELKNYLDTLRSQYADGPDGEEIVADIEARIAELILSTQDNSRTVELPLIKNIIAQMGSAAQIEEESHDEENRRSSRSGGNGGASRTERPEQPRIPRRLYRDPEEAKLGGVCTGLGKYFDLDPVWIRLLFFLPVLVSILSDFIHMPFFQWMSGAMGNLFGIFVLGYLIMWFAIPTARTARQKLEMNGERITAQSISEATGNRNDVDGHSKAVVADTVSTLGQVILILLKIFAGVLVFGLILSTCALIIGLFTVGIFDTGLFGWSMSSWVPVLGILIVLIPCMLLIYVLMCLIASRRPSGKATLWVFLLWILTFIILVVVAIREYNSDEWRWSRALPAPSTNIENLLNDAAQDLEGSAQELENARDSDAEPASAGKPKDSTAAVSVNPDEVELQVRVVARQNETK